MNSGGGPYCSPEVVRHLKIREDFGIISDVEARIMCFPCVNGKCELK